MGPVVVASCASGPAADIPMECGLEVSDGESGRAYRALATQAASFSIRGSPGWLSMPVRGGARGLPAGPTIIRAPSA